VIFIQQKQFENEQALRYLPARLATLDSLTDKRSRTLQLARGLLAGNVFDWGAKEVADIMEKGDFNFEDAESRLQGMCLMLCGFYELKLQGNRAGLKILFVAPPATHANKGWVGG